MSNVFKLLLLSFWATNAFAVTGLKSEYSLANSKVTVKLVPQEVGTRKDLQDVPLNKIFSFQINVLNASEIRELKFDARMPGHDHGMLVKPKVMHLGQNRFYVEGVKLHMQGHWKMLVQMKIGKEWQDLSIPLDL